MCDTCGCSDNGKSYKIIGTHESHEGKHIIENHGHSHGHGHSNSHVHSELITVNTPVLDKNNLLAERNRGYFEAKNIKAFNLVSSPGSGKTSLLEQIIKLNGTNLKIFVIEGDQQTTNDALRIEKAGAKAVQINTGNGCHLDAEMVNTAIRELNPAENSLLFIENVGNLVCPALFDLGENCRILISSVTEGDDKPLKYPAMFESSQICVINKIDLLPHVDFDLEKFKENACRINHHLQFFETSATKETGLKELIRYLLD